MSLNKEFYKRVGFVFVGIIAVLTVARYTVLSGDFIQHKSAIYNKGPQKVINWQDADKYIGKYATVEGKIVKTYNSGKACFLNFHPDYKRYFTAVIFSSDFDKFPQDPELFYKNKEVQVRGTIKEYHGSPEIILNSPSQIKIIK